MVLVGMAVTAVSGCVTVEPVHRTGPEARPGTSSGTPEWRVEPRIVQAPVREALEAAGGAEESPRPVGPRPYGQTLQADPPATHRAASDRAAGTSGRSGTLPRPEGETQERHTGRVLPAPSGAPSVPPAAVPAEPEVSVDVCGLGERYGRWHSDSPQARICRGAYEG